MCDVAVTSVRESRLRRDIRGPGGHFCTPTHPDTTVTARVAAPVVPASHPTRAPAPPAPAPTPPRHLTRPVPFCTHPALARCSAPARGPTPARRGAHSRLCGHFGTGIDVAAGHS